MDFLRANATRRLYCCGVCPRGRYLCLVVNGLAFELFPFASVPLMVTVRGIQINSALRCPAYSPLR